ncbi:MAG: POTRA domain-containing protein [Pseudobdellovibrionaceae bacterium]
MIILNLNKKRPKPSCVFKSIVWLFVFTVYFSVCVFAQSDEAQIKKIGSIDFNQVPNEIFPDVKSYFGDQLKVKDPSPALLDEVVRFLHTRNRVEKVKILQISDGSYYVQLEQSLLVGDFKWQGLNYFSKSEAREMFPMKKGDIFVLENLIQAAEDLRLKYKEAGFLNTVIDLQSPSTDSIAEITIKLQENPRTYIQQIELQSDNSDLNKKLNNTLKSFIKEPYSEENLKSINERIKQYLLKNRFIHAEIKGPETIFIDDEKGARLSFVIENPDQYEINFSGNVQISSSKIEDELDLDRFSSKSPSLMAEISSLIQNYYIAQGFANCEVLGEEIKVRSHFIKLNFAIKEMTLVKVQKIIFNGKYSKSDKDYEKLLKENASALFQKNIYIKSDFDSAIEQLQIQLQNQGYLLAKVLSTRTQYTPEKSKVNIFVSLDEGPLTVIKHIQFVGNKNISNEELLQWLDLKEGQPLRFKKLEISIAQLKSKYKDNGFIEMQILNEKQNLIQYDNLNTEAKIYFEIEEGPKVRVGSIVIDGNSFTKSSVVLTELDLKVGDLLTPTVLEEATLRLQKTGYFNSVEVKTLEEKTNVESRTLLVKVTERDPGLFNLGAGATNERNLTVRGYTGVAYRNLNGTGRGISLRLEGNYNVSDIKYLESKITFGYLEPYLLNSRVRGRVNLTRAKSVSDYDLRQVTELNQITYSIEKDFTLHLLGVWEIWSLATVSDFGIDSTYPYPPSTLDIATTGPTFDLDYRDNPFNPTSGTFSRLSIEYSDPQLGSTETIKYIKSLASFTHYGAVAHWKKQPVVWANNLRYGYLENLSTLADGGVPYDKKGFILGGRSTVRGYEAGTLESFPNRNDLGSDKYYLRTEAQMFLLKSELRFPLTGNFSGALFYDGGSVVISDLYLKDSYRDSLGFGLRYNTPVGPVSAEFAWKLDRRDKEEPWRFHLSIGSF